MAGAQSVVLTEQRDLDTTRLWGRIILYFAMDWLCFGTKSGTLPGSSLSSSEVKEYFLFPTPNRRQQDVHRSFVFHRRPVTGERPGRRDGWIRSDWRSNCISEGPRMNYPALICHYHAEARAVVRREGCGSTPVFAQLQGVVNYWRGQADISSSLSSSSSQTR